MCYNINKLTYLLTYLLKSSYNSDEILVDIWRFKFLIIATFFTINYVINKFKLSLPMLDARLSTKTFSS